MKYTHHIIDVETLDVESTAVILSIGVIGFDLDEKPDWDSLLKRSMFIKFSVVEQVGHLKRTINKSTMEWWVQQSEIVRDKSFKPSKYDLEAQHGFDVLREHCNLHKDPDKNRDVTFWARGALDQITIDSLSKACGGDILIPYSNWRDVRTAIDLTKDTANRGYCDVPGFDRGIVHKHDPVQDCALDLMMLLNGV